MKTTKLLRLIVLASALTFGGTLFNAVKADDDDLDAEAYCNTCQQEYDSTMGACQPLPEDCEEPARLRLADCQRERCIFTEE